ncbi:MAG: hypothetical protein GY799_04405 [Desulfobulbaceae bacterium]|nr:hypothetical protein [Desulfobulbaceae bacterium]
MKKQLEIAIIKANSASYQGCEIFWVFGRNQLEFLFKEVEMFSSPPFVTTAKYQEVMLPVINLEKYFGLKEKGENGPPRFLVVRSVNEEKEMVKLIVQIPQTMKIHKLETEFEPLQSTALPQNNADILGMYSLATDKLAVVPDFVGMSRSLQLRGNQDVKVV